VPAHGAVIDGARRDLNPGCEIPFSGVAASRTAADPCAALRFRYVLHLVDGDNDQIVRHVTVRPLQAGDVVTVAGSGDWRIVNLVAGGDGVFNNGIAYCEAATSGGADEQILSA
jgi:hypothetical protein